MNEKDISKICTALKAITLKPIVFNDIKLELLDAIRAKHAPGTIYSKHHHPWFEFNFFSQGAFETQMCSKKFICKKGQALLIPPGADHSQKSGSEGDDGICIRWQLSTTGKDVSKEAYRFMELINQPQPEPLNVNIDTLLGVGESSQLNSAIFLHFILSIYDKWQCVPSIHIPKQLISNQAILYMEEYLQHQILAADIARALNMSYRSLARIFKKETGVSVIEKLNEIRINKACKLLAESDMTISKIAEEVGYENIYYFSNTFKKYTGYSPKQFRDIKK